MPFNFKKLLVWFLVYYLVGDPLRDLIMRGETDVFDFFTGLTDFFLLLSGLLVFGLYSLLGYTALYLYFPQKRWLSMAGLLIASFFVPVGLRYLLEQVLYDALLDFTNYKKDVDLLYYLRDNLYYAFRFVSFGVIYYLAVFSMYREKREKNLLITNQKMELSLLKSQINPHFLLNALNNVYSLVFRKSEHALSALEMLSGILKYALYEKREVITVAEEMAYVKQYIELQRMRYDYPLALDVQVEQGAESKEIPQFLLISLVENSFKHGDLRDAEQPMRLHISSTEGQLQVVLWNRKNQMEKDEQGGIGLDNIRKRLELLYEGRSRFEVIDQEHTFEITLQIPLA